MPMNFQWVMDSTIGNMFFNNGYLDDILISSEGSFQEHRTRVEKILSTLDKNNFAVILLECKFCLEKHLRGLISKIRN